MDTDIDQHGAMTDMSASADGAGTHPRGAPPEAPVPRSATRRTIARTVKIVLLLVTVLIIGPPAIAKGSQAFQQLSRVNLLLLLVGLALELAAIVAYSQLTRTALPQGELSLPMLVRIQLATKAVTNLVPGGSAAGSALGYRLLVVTGVEGTDAGFALATAGLGSAVVLNLLLWVTLLVSIPFAGFNPIYVSMALLGVFLLGSFAVIVVGLMRGQDVAERAVRRIARRFRFIDEDRVGDLVRHLATRIRDLIGDRDLLRRVVSWAVLNWLLDASALWVFLRAFGVTVRPDSLIVAFCVANISAVIPITPGGLGVLDATMIAMLSFFGYGVAAGFGVPVYRLAQYVLPILLGGLAYLTLRLGPWRIDRENPLADLRAETGAIVDSGESVFDWAEKYGQRRRSQDPTGEIDRPVPDASGPDDPAP